MKLREMFRKVDLFFQPKYVFDWHKLNNQEIDYYLWAGGIWDFTGFVVGVFVTIMAYLYNNVEFIDAVEPLKDSDSTWFIGSIVFLGLFTKVCHWSMVRKYEKRMKVLNPKKIIKEGN